MTDDLINEELDDLAAELDDTTLPEDDDPDEDEDEDEDAATFDGACTGGPYDGRLMSSRFPRGFLLADRVRGLAWVYDYDAGVFTCRDGEPAPLDTGRRWLAAEGQDFDVVAYDHDGPPQ